MPLLHSCSAVHSSTITSKLKTQWWVGEVNLGQSTHRHNEPIEIGNTLLSWFECKCLKLNLITLERILLSTLLWCSKKILMHEIFWTKCVKLTSLSQANFSEYVIAAKLKFFSRLLRSTANRKANLMI